MSDTPRTDVLEKVDRDEWDKYYKEHTDGSFDEFLVYDIARGFERELAEMRTQRDAAVAARIELAKDNLFLLKQLESIGTTNCIGVTGMTMRQAYKIAALHSLAKRLQNGNSYTADDIAATCGELADAMTWEDQEVNK